MSNTCADNAAEKGEWPLSSNAAFEQPVDPSEPFDFEAVPSTFYFNMEAVGSIPVKDIIVKGLDLLVDKLAATVLAVQKETGVDEDEADDQGGGIIEPEMNGGGGQMGGYGGEQWMNGGGGAGWGGAGGSGMSPLRR